MKVLYLAIPLRNGTGGDRRSFEVLTRMPAYGIEPVVVLDQKTYEKISGSGLLSFFKGIKIYCINRPNKIYSRYFKSVSKALLEYYSVIESSRIIAAIAKKENVDLIVSHHEKIDYIIEAFKAAKKCSRPWTCIVQSTILPPYESTEWRTVSPKRKMYNFALYGYLFRFAAKAMMKTTCLAVSPTLINETRKYLKGWNGKMLPLNPGNGVNSEKARLIKQTPEKFDGAFLSRLSPEKGILELPDIVREIVKEKPDSKFAVIGRFELKSVQEEFEEKIREYALTKNVECKGFLNEEQFLPILKSSTVLLYPSKFDSFSLSVLEALACGTPSVGYDIPALITNYPIEAVKTVPIGDYKALATEAIKILKDDKLRAELSIEALSFAANFSWENVAKKERETYKQIFESQK
jgi:glycosyltransferase involved in cell wall biosynthesis